MTVETNLTLNRDGGEAANFDSAILNCAIACQGAQDMTLLILQDHLQKLCAEQRSRLKINAAP